MNARRLQDQPPLIARALALHGAIPSMDGVQDPRPQVPLLRSLEGLRLIASLGIVAIHMLPHVGIAAPSSFDLFVDMFFVISGIVIGHLYAGRIGTIGDYTLFVRRRLARIYPLHLATLLFYILIGIAIKRAHMAVDAQRFAPEAIVPNLLLVQAWGPGQLAFNFVSWSISAEWLLYLLFPVLAYAVTRSFGWGLATVIALLLVAIGWSEFHYSRHLFDLRWDYGAVRALPSFAFGVWLAAFVSRLDGLPGMAMVARAFAMVALAALIEIVLGAPRYLLLVTLYAVVTTALLSDMRAMPTLVAWRPLSDRGYLTYSLYMLHVPVATVFLSFVFPHLLGVSAPARWLGLAASLPILFALAELSFRKFEDPLRRRLR